MIIGESARVATVLSQEEGKAVQDIEMADLRTRLTKTGQRLA